MLSPFPSARALRLIGGSLLCVFACGCTTLARAEAVVVTGRVVEYLTQKPVAGVDVNLKVLSHGLFRMSSYRTIATRRSASDGTFRFAVPPNRLFAIQSRDGREIFGGGYKAFDRATPGMFVLLRHKHSKRPVARNI